MDASTGGRVDASVACRLFAAVLAGLALVWSEAAASDLWLGPDGVDGLPWGTHLRPDRVKRTDRSQHLADDGFAGRAPSDQPDDFEVLDRNGTERRFLRYVDGQLVDAWVMRDGSIDDTHYAHYGREQFKGAVVGPAEPGWVAVGDAVSWEVGGRTVLHWRDRLTHTEVLASRAVPAGRYAAMRPEPLGPPDPSPAKVGLKGDLKKLVKSFERELAACFDTAAKPVRATISLRYDRLGRLARVRVDNKGYADDVEACVAGSLIRTGAAPNLEGSFELYRHQ